MTNNHWQVVALVSSILTPIAVAGNEWTQWRGASHDGISRETTWQPGAVAAHKVAWEAQVGAGYSSVAVAGGKVYTAGNFNKVTDAIVCLDFETGKVVWKHEYPEPLEPKYYSGGCSATPTIFDGKVYFASKSGKVFCLDAVTGKVQWNKAFGLKMPTWGFASSALIHGKSVVFNAGKAGVAYDKDSGEVVWTSADEVCGYATPVPFSQQGKNQLALFTKDTLTVVSADDGKLVWTYPWQTQYDVNAADPIIVGNQVFIASGYGHGCAVIDFSGSEPQKVWQNKNMRSHMSGPVAISGYLYGFDDNRLTCLDWKTGEVKWVEKSPQKGALMAAGDKLIVLGETGRLAIAEASPSAYKELSACQAVDGKCWTMPVLVNGHVLVRNSDGHLVCLDVR